MGDVGVEGGVETGPGGARSGAAPVALVTGGARGIGRAIAAALAAAGFDVAIASLEPEGVAAAAIESVTALGRRALYLEADVAAIETHEALIARVRAALGPIACLVNNAGVTSLRRGDMLELTPESFDRCIAVNLRGTFFLTQAVARAMLAAPVAQYRSIITITSLNAEVLGLTRADYCVSKAGSTMATRLFAARLAEAGVNVFEVRPGIIRTDMTAAAAGFYDGFIAEGGVPARRWGEPEEVGRMVATIAGGALPFDTGDTIHVGGGVHLHRI